MSKILIVEDNDLNRDMLSRRLERKGYEIINAVDGREGVAKAQAAAPDLILMDMNLPVLDGWEATRQLKAAPATRAIPVVALTAHAMVGDREKAIGAGCDDYEMKPVDLPRLLAKIHALLAKESPAPAEAKYSLLVVDDNEMNSDMLSRRLERQEYQITVARTGREALDWIRKQPFDLVLLDVMMPEMNGLEVLRIVRATYSLIDLPVIIVTAKDQSDDVVTALQMGANDYLAKPLNFPIVLARIQTQLRLKDAHRGQASKQRSSPQPLSRTLCLEPAQAAAARGNMGRGEQGGTSAAGSFSRSGAAAVVAPAPVAVLERSAGPATLLAEPPRGGGGGNDPFSGREQRPDRHTGGEGRHGREAVRTTMMEGHTETDRLTIAGYEVLGELGHGGMGVVYKARHERMNRLVALKVIDKEHLSHPSAIRRFYREIQAAAQLQHPNIVMAYDAGQFDGTHFFAMEYVEGIDLSQLVKQSGPLPVAEACSYVRQAARGLHHAFERGLVHRDIKPSNLLITWVTGTESSSAQGVSHWARPNSSSTGRATVKILDMGLALLHQPTELSEAANGLTRDGRVVGTADYMAPEQWTNAHKVDIRADLYSLGCTFYFLLTGQVPFPGHEPMEKMLKHHLDEPEPLKGLRPEIPPKVVAVVERLMAKKPEHRFQQPWELAEALK